MTTLLIQGLRAAAGGSEILYGIDLEVSSGEVSINFFPLGQSEKAMLELGDDSGEQYTVLVYGLTGRVELRDGAVDPDKHMRRNAAGDEEEDK